MQTHAAYLNLGCELMASSGKNSDFETPFSTGVGRYSGWVKPGQPNLNKKQQVYISNCKSKFIFFLKSHYIGLKHLVTKPNHLGKEVMVQRVSFWFRTDDAS